jgi:inorganic phosphate transporter, PiT family
MAINIWANDIANNMWPAVWSKALTLTWAIIIAIIAEASWAIIAWWDVVDTIKGGIINPEMIKDTKVFLTIMMSTLVWAALWINIATFFKAPVSATHSIIGWLIWAWVTASWIKMVSWSKIWSIMLSWIISPLMWWIIAVIFMIAIRKTIFDKDNRWESAKKWVPIFIWLMSCIFTIYLMLKWVKKIYHIYPQTAIIIWLDFWLIIYALVTYNFKKKSAIFKDSKKFINKLFHIPLIFAVALLSFAHWANDVANAIWPLAAINDIVKTWEIWIQNVWIPLWIMFIWAIWLALWLAIFWARLIMTVWKEITKLNQTRAFSVALAAAITVIIASQLWLPVSSTHIAIWWIFWVWFLKEFRKRNNWKTKTYIEKSMIKSIALAWIITLPMSALISSAWYFIIIRF